MQQTLPIGRHFTIDFAGSKFRFVAENHTRGGKLDLSASDTTRLDANSEFPDAVCADLHSGDMTVSPAFTERLFTAHSGHTGRLGGVAGQIGFSAFGGALGTLGAFTRTMFLGAIGMAFSSVYGFAMAFALTVTFGVMILSFGAILLGIAVFFGVLALLARIPRERAWRRFEADQDKFFLQVSLHLADLWDKADDDTADALEAGLKAPRAMPVHNIAWLGGLTFGVLTGSEEEPCVLAVQLATARPAPREDRRQKMPIETILTAARSEGIKLLVPVRSDGGSRVRAPIAVGSDDLGVRLIRAGLALPLEDEVLGRVLRLDDPSHDFLAHIPPASRAAETEAQREERGVWGGLAIDGPSPALVADAARMSA